MFAANRHFFWEVKGKRAIQNTQRCISNLSFPVGVQGNSSRFLHWLGPRRLLGQRSNCTLQCCSIVRSWPPLLPQTRYPAVMTLTNHVLLASGRINDFLLQISFFQTFHSICLFAITQQEFCMDANADIFLEQIAFDNVCRNVSEQSV